MTSESTSNNNFIIDNTALDVTLDDADQGVFEKPPPNKRGKSRYYEETKFFSTLKEAG